MIRKSTFAPMFIGFVVGGLLGYGLCIVVYSRMLKSAQQATLDELAREYHLNQAHLLKESGHSQKDEGEAEAEAEQQSPPNQPPVIPGLVPNPPENKKKKRQKVKILEGNNSVISQNDDASPANVSSTFEVAQQPSK